VENFSLKDDEELKDNYIIREIFLPTREGDGETDVKIIYPIPNYVSPELNELANEISEKIKNDPTNTIKPQWDRIVRQLKIQKLNE